MKTDVTTCIIIDTRRKRNDCLYPIKLRVTFNRYSKYYSLNYALTEDEFEKVNGKAPRSNLKLIKRALLAEENRAQDIINKNLNFSFESFDSDFLHEKKVVNNIYELIEYKVKDLVANDRFKTAWVYESLMSSLKKFKKRRHLPFSLIDKRFLNEYEKWMLANKKSITTVGIYLRNLRAVFNDAIDKKIIGQDKYPFGKNKYQIPTGNNVKKALSKMELLKIANYKSTNSMELYCRDLFLFSYLANGINIKDLANMKYTNIQDGFLILIREKTKNSKSNNPQFIKIYCSDRIINIIENWGNLDQHGYIFPIFRLSMTTLQKIRKVDSTIGSINLYIGRIAKSVGIDQKVTTYVARHTFSTVLKRSGASIEFISESLGHHSISTTRHYLDSFEDEEKIKWSGKLL